MKTKKREAVGSIFWTRLDLEGHDACRLYKVEEGWLLRGVALFVHEGDPCCLRYAACCDDSWRTQGACVEGWLGDEEINLDIARGEGDAWRVNGEEQPQVAGCIDVDLNFTPATNLIALRRYDLAIGAETPAPAAWLRFPEFRLERLDQTYRRLNETSYAYRAPSLDFETTLMADALGFITSYPPQWMAKVA